ncbi:MAG: hypothetical protein RL235_805 [Chlamydiota bacterium]|jgi:hypothetical protein
MAHPVQPTSATLSKSMAHELLVRPAGHAAELTTEIIQGTDPFSVAKRPLSLKEKIISIGIIILIAIPIINIITWIFLETFGHARSLTDPVFDEKRRRLPREWTTLDDADVAGRSTPLLDVDPSLLNPAASVQATAAAAITEVTDPLPPMIPPGIYSYREVVSKKKGKPITDVQADWHVHPVDSDGFVLIERFVEDDLRGELRYHNNRLIAAWINTSDGKRFEGEIDDNDVVSVTRGEATKECETSSAYPWGQDPVFGMSSFIKSSATTTHFTYVEESTLMAAHITGKKIANTNKIELTVNGTGAAIVRFLFPSALKFTITYDRASGHALEFRGRKGVLPSSPDLVITFTGYQPWSLPTDLLPE